MKMEGMTQEQSDLYHEGKKAHANGQNKDSCPSNMRKKCWWLAGWIDADIEAGNKIWGSYGNSSNHQ